MSVLDAAAREKLPDSAYAMVYTTVETKNGRTSRVKVRKFPVHDAAHVRDALARLGQEKGVPSGVMAKGRAKIMAAAKKFGITGGE